MHESSKALARRLHDSRFATRFFVGHGIDIGAGPDSLGQYTEQFPLMRSCRSWDLDDGDAQFLATIGDDSLDFAHSSHCLEHMRDPRQALEHWLRVIKPGGHLIVTIPDEDLYEQGVFPSTYNEDHKWTFTMHKVKSWSPKSVNLMVLLSGVAGRAQTIKVEQLDATYRFEQSRFDQTMTPVAECGLEFVLRKLPREELDRLGRFPDPARTAQAGMPERSTPTEPMPAERNGNPEDSKKHRWKFLAVPLAFSLLFNANRHGKAGFAFEQGEVAVIAGEAVGAMLLGYVAWWLWSTIRKLRQSMRPSD